MHRSLLYILIFCSFQVAAQVKWLNQEHDFGLIREAEGIKRANAGMVNLGADTLYIMEVKPSCGCTTVSFTTDAIAPGDTAFVEYAYNPAMRPGIFDKSIKIRLSDNSRHTLRLKGNVLGTPESLATMYPLDAGEARVSETHLMLGEVRFGRSPLQFINVYAAGPDSISPRLFTSAQGVAIDQSSPSAAPGDVVTFSVNFDSRRHAQYGPVQIPLFFKTHESDKETHEVKLTAFVIPDVESLIKIQGDCHPVCQPAESIVDLSEISARDKLKFEIDITNTGDAPLHIYRVYADSPAFTITGTPQKAIKPGKTAKIKITLIASRLEPGAQRRQITIISDDVRNPVLNVPVAIDSVP